MMKARCVLARRWPIVAVAVVVALVAGWLTRPSPVEAGALWSADQLLALDLSRSDGTSFTITQSAPQITSGQVLSTAAADLGGYDDPDDLDDLVDRVTATPDTDAFTIRITAIAGDPAEATEIVSAFSTAFIEVDDQREDERRRSSYDAAFTAVDNLEVRRDAFVADHPDVVDPSASPDPVVLEAYLELDRDYRTAVATVSETEREVELGGLFRAESPEKPRKIAAASTTVPEDGARRWILFGLGGLVAGLVAAWVVERRTPRIDLDSEIVAELGISVIGHVGSRPPRRPESFNLQMEPAEEYRRIASVVRYLINRPTTDVDSPGSVFMFTSADVAEGKSTSVAMTSLCLAEAGVPTLALGCDYRKPVLDVMLGVERRPGIVERSLPSTDRPGLDQIVRDSGRDDLWVVPSGEPVKRPVGCNDVAREVIDHARADGLVVVVDTAPLRVTGDAVDLLDAVDDVILVVRSGRTRVGGAREAVEMVEGHGGRICGAVLTGSRQARSRGLRRYARSYGSVPVEETAPT